MRTFFRIIAGNAEVYGLKIATLAVAFASSIVVILFFFNELGYDRHQDGYDRIFRILKKYQNAEYTGNRLSAKIPETVFSTIGRDLSDLALIARVKIMKGVTVVTRNKIVENQTIHAADPSLTSILSFNDPAKEQTVERQAESPRLAMENTVILSESEATMLFDEYNPTGEWITLVTFGDSVRFRVSGVFKDLPVNSHAEFKAILRWDDSAVKKLCFNQRDFFIYGKLLKGNLSAFSHALNQRVVMPETIFSIQKIADIYFGPRVLGEEVVHGDSYSVLIFGSIGVLILILAIASFVNLTTLSLPKRVKELAIKKIAGAGQGNLILFFGREVLLLAAFSLVAGAAFLFAGKHWISPMLPFNFGAAWRQYQLHLFFVLLALIFLIALVPMVMVFRFVTISPKKLLSDEKISYPRIKAVITVLQLGLSISLIIFSAVIKRQVNYSLLKEPGRNHDQIVYVDYPRDMTPPKLNELANTWRAGNPNILGIMATSQLPDQVSGKELHSPFYRLIVSSSFADFFNLHVRSGRWFGASDDDGTFLVNERGSPMLADTARPIGILPDFSEQYNLPEKALKISAGKYTGYNFLFIRILEVDIRQTIGYLDRYFKTQGRGQRVRLFDKKFEAWLDYQDALNRLSTILTVMAGLLSCFAIYGLSVSIVHDKIRTISIHKLFGARASGIIYFLSREFLSRLVLAIVIFVPATWIFVREFLRNFVYATRFKWFDPIAPILFCVFVIVAMCTLQARKLNRTSLRKNLS